jgi:two-component system CheB/CheR fusion protein
MQPQARRRVLLLEDSQDQAESLRFLLEVVGYEVRVADDGPDGVRLAAEWTPDVIVCDICLPGLDGYGVAAEVRRNPATAHVRLVALTAYGTDEDSRRRAREAGFDHHLIKPADPAVLLQLLARPS